MRRYSITSIILLFGFIAIMVYVIFSYWTQPIDPWALLPPIISFIFLWFSSGVVGEFVGFVIKQKNFITEGGAVGVLRSITHHQGGMTVARVTTYKRYVKNKELIVKEDALGGVASLFSATVTIEIPDKTYKFKEIESVYCDAPEGTVMYEGTLSGIKIPSVNDEFKKHIKYLTSVISKQETIVEKAITISSQEAQQQNLDMVESIKKATIALKDIMKAARPPVKPVSPSLQE